MIGENDQMLASELMVNIFTIKFVLKIYTIHILHLQLMDNNDLCNVLLTIMSNIEMASALIKCENFELSPLAR
jgi:hypothetical protein